MKLGIRRYRYSWFVIFCLAAMLAVVVCNIWLLRCGRCVASDVLLVPPVGWAIIAANLVAGVILLILKKRRNVLPNGYLCCNCHSALRENWPYCPACGSSR